MCFKISVTILWLCLNIDTPKSTGWARISYYIKLTSIKRSFLDTALFIVPFHNHIKMLLDWQINEYLGVQTQHVQTQHNHFFVRTHHTPMFKASLPPPNHNKTTIKKKNTSSTPSRTENNIRNHGKQYMYRGFAHIGTHLGCFQYEGNKIIPSFMSNKSH